MNSQIKNLLQEIENKGFHPERLHQLSDQVWEIGTEGNTTHIRLRIEDALTFFAELVYELEKQEGEQ